ncbi:MAG: hypothetical protein JKY56_12500 [Kofleriaceae bacterium]|nr:hypothetical protein [Kofleriaceae bacterium]
MSPIPSSLSRSYLAKQMGTMVYSQVHIDNTMALVRAATWHNSAQRLGIHLPLFVVYDIGALLTSQPGVGGYEIRPSSALGQVAPSESFGVLLNKYEKLIRRLAESDVVEKLAGWRLRDDLIAVLLIRILSDTYQHWDNSAKSAGAEELPLDPILYQNVDFAEHEATFGSESIESFLQIVNLHELHIYTSTELIDLDTVRLLGLFKEDSAHGADALGRGLDLVDLFAALDSPEANDVAKFSLDLLPSVLETKRAAGVQAFAMDGYASIERKGNIDSLMLSELAYDDEIFEQKVVDQELLYFGHERERDDERRLHYVLVDSSASMRGKRQVFARGLALTLVKKLSLQGDEIWLRFFDSRLHEIVKVARGSSFPVPYLLSFRSEHGRNYGKVFRQLVLEMTRLKRDQHRNIVVYIITHGQCHVDPELIAALSQQASLYGIVILPSSELSLDFLPLLDRQQIVENDTFQSRAERRNRALDIVDNASSQFGRSPVDGSDSSSSGSSSSGSSSSGGSSSPLDRS